MYAREFDEARIAFREALRLEDTWSTRYAVGWNELASGHPDRALPYCERDETWYSQICLAIAYHHLGRQKEARAMLAGLQAENGTGAALQYAEIYAQFGQSEQALDWLATALKSKDGGLAEIKVDPFLDPIRNTARFREIVERLNFP